MTTEDLKQIGELLEPINKRLENVEKNMATKSDLEAVREQIATKEDLASVKQEIKAAIKREAESMADFFHDTWDKMQTTNERVEKIEDHLDLPHSHNN